MNRHLIDYCIESFFAGKTVTVFPYVNLPLGKKVIDNKGDYIVLFYHVKTNRIMCFFKDLEKYWFCWDDITLYHDKQ